MIGLDNPNQYCYMNAVIQILLSIKEFRQYFFKKEFRSINYATHFQKKTFCNGIAKLFKEMLTLEDEYDQLKPLFFHKLIESRFTMTLQHDAHEFLIYLLG